MNKKKSPSLHKTEFYDNKVEKDFYRLSSHVQQQLKTKLKARTKAPRNPKAALHSHKDCYKIKLTKPQVRLVYKVMDKKLIISVVAIGTRDKIYRKLDKMLS